MVESKNSVRFQLNAKDMKKVWKGLLIAVTGAVLTYGSEAILNIDFGDMTPLAVAGWGVLANLVRKWL